MSKSKQVKAQLKREQQWTSYRRIYRKAGALMLSKIALAIAPALDIAPLVELEKTLLAGRTEASFVSAAEALGGLLKIRANWSALGSFLFYAASTASYRHDLKNGQENPYCNADVVLVNALKRKHFHTWMASLPLSLAHYNETIRAVMRYAL